MEGFILHAKVETLLRLEREQQMFDRKPNILLESWLKEEQGLPSQILEMVDRITSTPFLERSWQRAKGEKSTIRLTFDMYPQVKDVKRNFIGPNSKLKLTILNPAKSSKEGGVYTGSDDSDVDPETGLLSGADILLNLVISTDEPFEKLKAQMRSPLSHELVHVYEDYNRRHLNRGTIFQTVADRGYVDPGSPNGFDQGLKYFVYLLDPSEQRAFIGEAVADVQDLLQKLEKAGKLDRVENIRNIDTFLQYSDFWGLYTSIRDWVEDTQWDNFPKWRQNSLLTAYNSLVQGQGRAPKNYNQLIKKIKFRWSEFDKNLKIKVGQVISKFVHPNRVMPVDTFGIPPRQKLSESLIFQAF